LPERWPDLSQHLPFVIPPPVAGEDGDRSAPLLFGDFVLTVEARHQFYVLGSRQIVLGESEARITGRQRHEMSPDGVAVGAGGSVEQVDDQRRRR